MTGNFRENSLGHYEDLSSMSSDGNNKDKVISYNYFFRCNGTSMKSELVHSMKAQVSLSQVKQEAQMHKTVDGQSKNIKPSWRR